MPRISTQIVSAICVSLCCIPVVPTFAQEPVDPAAVTRRDGFVNIIWNSLRRPAFDSREKPFSDVPQGSSGFREITYAKARGLVDDAEAFRPNDPLMVSEALILLLRTRNVADPDEITPSSLPLWLKRYPLGDFVDPTEGENGTLTDRPVTDVELQELAVLFDRLLREETHEVSFYSEKFHGKGTAFGETFDMYAMTAAHRTFPHNTVVRVTNVANGKSVVVRINDRGPFIKGRDMDLSLGAFLELAERKAGKLPAVTFERLGDVTMIEQAATSSQKPTSRRCPTGTILERLRARAQRRGVAVTPCENATADRR